MPDEDGFLALIRDTPSDDITRLVYADWLDEQEASTGGPKAEFIRLELRLSNEPYSFGRTEQLRLLAERLDPDWMMVISHPQIERCTARLKHECPSLWSRLTPTRDPHIRTCDGCLKRIYYARTPGEAQDYARHLLCLAVAPALPSGGLPFAVWRPLPLVAQPSGPLIDRPRLTYGLNADGRSRQTRVELDEPESAETWEPVWGPGPTLPRPRRQNTRRKHRNIQRENWEQME